MKALIIATVLVTTLSANASFFQNYCSNAQGTTTTADGHAEFYTKVTSRTWDNGNQIDKVIELDLDKVDLSTFDEVKISEQISKYCEPGSSSGYVSWEYVITKKVILTNRDGSLFSKDIVGVSDDQKTISTMVICTEEGNSRTDCSNN